MHVCMSYKRLLNSCMLVKVVQGPTMEDSVAAKAANHCRERVWSHHPAEPKLGWCTTVEAALPGQLQPPVHLYCLQLS